MRCSDIVSAGRIVSRDFAFLVRGDFYLSGVLKEGVYSNNPRNENKLWDNIQNVVFSVSPAQIRRAMTNTSVGKTRVCEPNQNFPSSSLNMVNKN
jgi:hypothetical protein